MDTTAIDYRGVALGVESAWPAFIYLDCVEFPVGDHAAEPMEDTPSPSIPNTA